MPSVKLSGNAPFGRYTVLGTDGWTEITQDEACSVSHKWTIGKLSDPNLLITFEESERETLLALEGKVLDLTLSELKIEGKASDVAKTLLGEKPKPKSKVSKAASKVVSKAAVKPKVEKPKESEDS